MTPPFLPARATFRRSWAALVLPVLVATTSVRTAWAQGESAPANTAEARAHFDRGVQLYKESDFRAALAEFRSAYKSAPNYNVLYNIGQTQFELGEYAGALDTLQKYLNEGGPSVPAARQKTVSEQIDKLKTRVGSVEITSNAVGAEVLVDDVPIGTTPVKDAVVVSAGRRRITVTKPGLVPLTKAVDVASGDKVPVNFELTEPPPATPAVVVAPRPETPPPAPTTGPRPYVVVAWATTGALAAGTVVTALLAKSSESDLKGLVDRAGTSRSELDSAQSDLKTKAVLTDVLGATTLVAAGVSLYLTLATGKGDVRSEGASARVVVLPSGAVVSGTF
ncbi:MAG: PEGA domain-containing protein [Polyangiaceae bacterium]